MSMTKTDMIKTMIKIPSEYIIGKLFGPITTIAN